MRAFSIVFLFFVGIFLTGCGGGGRTADVPALATLQAEGGAVTTATAPEVFALMDPGDDGIVFDSFAALDTVDGLALRLLWRQVEPENGSYDWTPLDAALDIVRARGKKLTVHIGVFAGAWPQWLQAAGMSTYRHATFSGFVTDSVPWDAVLLEQHGLLVSALAAHLRDRGDLSLVRAVSDGAPVAEMSLVACQNGKLGDIAYQRADYLQAWKTSIAAYAGAFPDTRIFVSAPISVICYPDNDGSAFYSDLMEPILALKGQFGIFAADLNAEGSVRINQVSSDLRQQIALGFQTIWSATDDPTNRMNGTLEDAICAGRLAGAVYFELYKADLSSTDADTRSAVQLARSATGCADTQ